MNESKIRFFIHNGAGVSTECVDDTREFLSKHVAASKDVLTADLRHNYDQLSSENENVVLVFPGGGAIAMYGSLPAPLRETITKEVNEKGRHYIGICAGAYLGARRLKALNPPTAQNRYPVELNKSDLMVFGLSLLWDSIGPLYPEAATHPEDPRVLNISIGNNQIPQLNIGGGTFDLQRQLTSHVPDDGSKALAYYPDSMKNFTYESASRYSKLSRPVAILSRKPFQGNNFKCGGTFFSANHFEACGADSKLINAVRKQLSEGDVEKLEQAEGVIVEQIVPLIKKSIGMAA